MKYRVGINLQMVNVCQVQLFGCIESKLNSELRRNAEVPDVMWSANLNLSVWLSVGYKFQRRLK